jgi:hypothetical protein
LAKALRSTLKTEELLKAEKRKRLPPTAHIAKSPEEAKFQETHITGVTSSESE